MCRKCRVGRCNGDCLVGQNTVGLAIVFVTEKTHRERCENKFSVCETLGKLGNIAALAYKLGHPYSVVVVCVCVCVCVCWCVLCVCVVWVWGVGVCLCSVSV